MEEITHNLTYYQRIRLNGKAVNFVEKHHLPLIILNGDHQWYDLYRYLRGSLTFVPPEFRKPLHRLYEHWRRIVSRQCVNKSLMKVGRFTAINEFWIKNIADR